MAGRADWVWQRRTTAMKPSDRDKERIVGACETLIRDVYMPTDLAETRPTAFNYCIDIRGDWRAGRYRFLQRMRSGFADNLGEEFDYPFARLDYIGLDSFNIQWMRHTGSWFRLHTDLTLDEAIDCLKTDTMLQPII